MIFKFIELNSNRTKMFKKTNKFSWFSLNHRKVNRRGLIMKIEGLTIFSARIKRMKDFYLFLHKPISTLTALRNFMIFACTLKYQREKSIILSQRGSNNNDKEFTVFIISQKNRIQNRTMMSLLYWGLNHSIPSRSNFVTMLVQNSKHMRKIGSKINTLN